MENVKRIPYGVSDFVDIIKRNQYYVDKTMYIPKLEEEADSLWLSLSMKLFTKYITSDVSLPEKESTG